MDMSAEALLIDLTLLESSERVTLSLNEGIVDFSFNMRTEVCTIAVFIAVVALEVVVPASYITKV